MFDQPVNRWWTVVAEALRRAVNAGGGVTDAFGIFVKSTSHEFGWNRSFKTAGFTCFFIVSGIGGLALGSIMQHWPMGAVITAVAAMFALMLMSVGFLPKSLVQFCTRAFSWVRNLGWRAGASARRLPSWQRDSFGRWLGPPGGV